MLSPQGWGLDMPNVEMYEDSLEQEDQSKTLKQVKHVVKKQKQKQVSTDSPKSKLFDLARFSDFVRMMDGVE